ncbi:hypothetical protein [Hymenobacter cavernae]|uniref:GOLD domain-containing protein n=1 Tax=Hymenobacter cavernae TaxID=2044852 RepID=A0ABQ1U2W6_9BACT|nr:hypothetical protein [Hymenobacter cavernae]GGF07824.1 hypothetical protein GCM10011383_18690 [Hymenobacter cavernae]
MKNTLIVFACFLLASCSLGSENTCRGSAVTYIAQATGPRTSRANEDVKFTVSFAAENSCGKFDKFIQERVGDSVKVALSVSYDGCVCTQVAVPIQADYTFKPTQPGTYYLKFLSGPTTYTVDTLTVQ